MKKFFCLLFSILAIFGGVSASAHGGVAQVAGNALVFLNQNPVSPLVGEQVEFTFVIKDKNFENLTNKSVELKVIDTYYGDESKDRTVLSKNFTTDANGAFSFQYAFPKENYFDIELAFKDPVTKQDDITGFLVQPRKASASALRTSQVVLAAFGGALVGVIAGYFGKRLLNPRSHE